MVEDWRGTFGILIKSLGAAPAGCGPEGSQIPFCINIVIVAYQIKSNEEYNTVVQKF